MPAGSFLTYSGLYRISWASLSLSLPLSLSLFSVGLSAFALMRLIAPERCVMSAQAFLLALLMWQFESCDYLVSLVTDGCSGELYSLM